MAMHIVFNQLGKGKTTFLTWLGLVLWIKGYTIYSNYWLAIPHIRVRSIEDLDMMGLGPNGERTRECSVLLCDDSYMWFYAPRGFNPWVDKILACSRKRNVDIIYVVTRSNQIHVNLRNNTAFCWIPMIIPQMDCMIAYRFRYLADRGLKGGDEERIGEPMGGYAIGNITWVWSQFDTYEEVDELKGFENGIGKRR
jgi:hypothetical protein